MSEGVVIIFGTIIKAEARDTPHFLVVPLPIIISRASCATYSRSISKYLRLAYTAHKLGRYISRVNNILSGFTRLPRP